MSTQAIPPRIDTPLITPQQQAPMQNDRTTGQSSADLNANESNTSTIPSNTPREVELSEGAVRMSESFEARIDQANNRPQPIEQPEEAQRMSEIIVQGAQQAPNELLAAQNNNLTSSVVRSLLG